MMIRFSNKNILKYTSAIRDKFTLISLLLNIYTKEFLSEEEKSYNLKIIFQDEKRSSRIFLKENGNLQIQSFHSPFKIIENNDEYEFMKITDKDEIKNICNTYFEKYYCESDDKDTWFNKIKEMCDNLGYASNMKEYKQNPDAFKGNVADVSTVLRVAITKKSQTPDLYEIMKLLGLEKMRERIEKI